MTEPFRPRKALVVARHQEDVGWLTQAEQLGYDVFVYDKGGDPAAARPLPNVGREADTYLAHVEAEYDRLDGYDQIVFAQADPFPHAPDFLAALGREPAPVFALQGFEWLGEHRFDCGPDGGPQHPGLRLGETWGAIVAASCRASTASGRAPDAAPDVIPFMAGAIFRVRGDLFGRRPRSFWREVRALGERYPEFPWVMERAWELLFREVGR